MYVLNYALLLVWGVSSVMIEATIGAEKAITSDFSAYFALAIGIFCACVHLVCPLVRRRQTQRAIEQQVRSVCNGNMPAATIWMMSRARMR